MCQAREEITSTPAEEAIIAGDGGSEKEEHGEDVLKRPSSKAPKSKAAPKAKVLKRPAACPKPQPKKKHEKRR